MATFSKSRAAVVMVLITICFCALIGRVIFLQTVGRQLTLERADRQQHQKETIIARRGSIYDSTGMLMAATVQTQALFLDPKFMQDCYQGEGHSLVEMDEAVEKLAKILDKNPFELSQLLGDKAESRFVKIADHLDENTVTEIEKLKIFGVGFVPQHERYYPMGAIAAHVLGGTGKDTAGLEGLELKYEKQLAGKNGTKRVLKDAYRRSLAIAAEDYIPPRHGQQLILTIDGNVQLIAEQELEAACKQYAAKRGEVIVMDPKTGDVLALANWPTFDPSNLEEADTRTRLNRCLTDPYEPGSTIKPFIAGPAMAWRITRPNEMWPITSIHWNPFGRRIVTDVHHYGPLSTWDVLVKSSNIGMTMLGTRMGNPKLYEALTGFGFGRSTEIDMPAEHPGMLRPLPKWGMNSTISISQGYELMVTPIQLCRAVCAYANGGRLVQPHVIKGWLDSDGNIIDRQQAKDLKMLPQAIDPLSAAGMKRILCDTLIRGTAKGCANTSWNIFGKTGTAHIAEHGSYSSQRFNSSFIGGAPAESPRLVITMVIHDPDKSLGHYGGIVSAPAAARVLERSLAYLQVPASPDLPPPPAEIASTLVGYDPAVYSKAGIARTASARE
ncbi:MAG TPA: penicillin-binding protein 2 [Tepidisphaeraceae bacterium]|jgi:cell division protein FtsI (penicillin-binding protein 3)